MRKIGFGIIGCGVISRWHAEAIATLKDCALIGATDRSKESAGAFSAKYNCIAFDSVEDLLTCPDIDVVSICTPSGLHAQFCIQAAEAGKHVITEKPMALNVADCDKIIEAADRNNVKICVISQLRFSHTVRSVKSAIAGGQLGKMLCGDIYMKYHRDREYYIRSPWRGTWAMDGGGALMNQGVHGVDTIQYLMGPVKSVYGNCRTLLHDIETEDTCSAVLEFKSGALGVIQATTSVTPGSGRRIELNGSKGTIMMLEDSVVEWSVDGTAIPADILIESSVKSGYSDPTNIGIGGHIDQISDMVAAIREGRNPAVDGREGKKPVEIICAIYKSSETGKRVDL